MSEVTNGDDNILQLGVVYVLLMLSECGTADHRRRIVNDDVYTARPQRRLCQ